jgi:flagellar motor switch protein FliM
MADETTPGTDAAAEEWSAKLEAEEKAKAAGAASGGDPARVLNQDEIDTLLGFDSKDKSGAVANGIYAILDKSLISYEKMPMLEVVFDRFVRNLSSSLRNFTSDNVEVSIDSMQSLRFEDFLNSIPLPALLVVFRAVEWETLGLVTVDGSLIYNFVDILLGGRKSGKSPRVEGRAYTTIEQDIMKKLVDIVLNDISMAFEPLSPVTFQFDRLETNPRFAAISRPNNLVLLVRMRVEVEDRAGTFELMFPHTMLEPIKDLLLQLFTGEKFGADTVWERHLGKELRQTDVDVDVVLDEKTVMLGDVMRFKVGSTLLLDATPDKEVTLRCGGVTIATGKMGRMGDHIAVSLNDAVRKRWKEKEQK